MLVDPTLLAAALCALVLAAVWLGEHTPLRHLGAALLVILLGAVASNGGLIPSGAGAPVAVYDGVFAYLAPLSIFWLLLGVDLREVWRAGGPVLGAFVLGAAGTTLGGIVAMTLLGGESTFGPQYAAVGGMYVGTYIGGSVNFNAVALEYGLVREGGLYAGSVAADNVVTAVWMVATLGLPRVLAPLWPKPPEAASVPEEGELGVDAGDVEEVGPGELALVGALGLLGLWGSDELAGWLGLPSMLVLTAVALLLAQIPAVAAMRGPRVLGMFAVYLFLAVIGAFCDVPSLIALGRLGPALLGLAAVTVAIHGVVTFVGARVLGMDLATAAVASQANVGGGTTALAVARSLGRDGLVLPAILVGSLGSALGTFLGFWVAEMIL